MINCHALCWRQGPVTLYSLKVKGERKVTSREKEKEKKKRKMRPLICLPFHMHSVLRTHPMGKSLRQWSLRIYRLN
jgi:hypothetical protein